MDSTLQRATTVTLSFCLLLMVRNASADENRDPIRTALGQKSGEFDTRYMWFDPESEIPYNPIGSVKQAIAETSKQIQYEPVKAEVVRLKRRIAKFNQFVASNSKLHSQLAPIREACSKVYEVLATTLDAPKGSIAGASRTRAEQAAQVCIEKYPLLLEKIEKHAREWKAIEPEVREALRLPQATEKQ